MKNIGTGPIHVGGLRFTEGIRFAFPDLELAAGVYLILAKDPTP